MHVFSLIKLLDSFPFLFSRTCYLVCIVPAPFQVMSQKLKERHLEGFPSWVLWSLHFFPSERVEAYGEAGVPQGFSISTVVLAMEMLDVELSLCRRMSCLFQWNVFIGYPVNLLCRCPGLAAKQPKARVIAERFGSWLKLSDDLCLLTESFHQLGWSAVPREVRATKVWRVLGRKSDFSWFAPWNML